MINVQENNTTNYTEYKTEYKGKVTLVSREGDKFEVEAKTAAMSELVLTMLTDGDDEEEDGEETIQEIPLPNIKSTVLAKVVEFCNYHVTNGPMKEIERPLKSANMAEVIGEWDANFVTIEQEELFEIILAAQYMDIKSLLDLTCAKVASMMKGKTPEEIRNTFNIVNDFTPEEKAAILVENKWSECA
jgi:S-phase kinase-associated protein 1